MNTVQAWKLDRTLTFGVVIALAVQSAGALIWAGGAGERLDQMERRLDDQGALSTPVAERLARLEEHALHTRASLDRIEQRLANQARPGEPPDGYD